MCNVKEMDCSSSVQRYSNARYIIKRVHKGDDSSGSNHDPFMFHSYLCKFHCWSNLASIQCPFKIYPGTRQGNFDRCLKLHPKVILLIMIPVEKKVQK